MLVGKDEFDPWQNIESRQRNDAIPKARITTIDNVVPLDDQFGAATLKFTPDALFEALFGAPIAQNDVEKRPGKDHACSVATYAILDAAKIPNLVELLFVAGLEHRCLFKGAAFDELKDVAPWIVRLEEDNRFTRQLFTMGQMPWCLWDKEPGVYLRSSASLDDLWAHFRKFTRVQDEAGKWFVAKFWSGVLWAAFMRDDALIDMPLFHALTAKTEQLIFTNDEPAQWFVIEPASGENPATPPVLPRLSRPLIEACNDVVILRQETADINHAIAAHSDPVTAAKIARNAFREAREWLIDHGFRDIAHIRSALTTLAERGMLVDKNWNADLYAMLSDQARGPGVRLWMLQNRQWN